MLRLAAVASALVCVASLAQAEMLPAYDPEAFGNLSERIARFLGTGRFIVWMSGTIVVCVLWNVLADRKSVV